MKRTLLLIMMLVVSGTSFSQIYSTGEQTLLTNLRVQLDIDDTAGITTLTLIGPSNAWFAIGFGALNMSSGADVFRTDGTDITDAKAVARQLPGADASQDWTLVSNTVASSERTIIATRANNTGDSDDFIFNATTGSIPIIYAHGSSTTYAYHGGNRGFTTLGVTLSNESVTAADFSLFPNPANDTVTLALNSNTEIATVELYDSLGRLTHTQEIDHMNKTMDLSAVTKGMYIVKVIVDQQIATQKLIKQ